MQIRFQCGHVFELDPDKVTQPACLQCGNRIVSRVSGDTPRIVGHASGPLVTSKYLDAVAVKLASQPLKLKPQED